MRCRFITYTTSINLKFFFFKWTSDISLKIVWLEGIFQEIRYAAFLFSFPRINKLLFESLSSMTNTKRKLAYYMSIMCKAIAIYLLKPLIVRAQLRLGTSLDTGLYEYNFYGYNKLLCLGTIISGHKRVWAQTCPGSNMSGHYNV